MYNDDVQMVYQLNNCDKNDFRLFAKKSFAKVIYHKAISDRKLLPTVKSMIKWSGWARIINRSACEKKEESWKKIIDFFRACRLLFINIFFNSSSFLKKKHDDVNRKVYQTTAAMKFVVG